MPMISAAGGLVGALPENGGAALGRDDGVDAVLQHHEDVGHAERQCTARAPFADDDADDGHFKGRHFQQVAADGLGLATLLGPHAGKGARGVDEGDDGQAELLGQLHQAQRLAIALGTRHAEVAVRALLGIAPLHSSPNI